VPLSAVRVIHRISKLFTDSVDIVAMISITRMGRVRGLVWIDQDAAVRARTVFAQRRPGVGESL
jgi:hypothetical protein